eukprot:9191753-Pyramimonas_sp.AAC.1
MACECRERDVSVLGLRGLTPVGFRAMPGPFTCGYSTKLRSSSSSPNSEHNLGSKCARLHASIKYGSLRPSSVMSVAPPNAPSSSNELEVGARWG